MNFKRPHKSLSVVIASKFSLGVIPFIQIPFIIRATDINTWAIIAIVQSIAIFFGPFFDLGWSARFWEQSKKRFAKELLVLSVKQKIKTFSIVAVASIFVFQFVINSDVTEVATQTLFLSFVSTLSAYLNNSWFWIADSNLRNLIKLEVFPKVGLNLLALMALLLTDDLNLFFVSVLFANLASPIYLLLINRTFLSIEQEGSLREGLFFSLGSVFRAGYLTGTLWILSILNYPQIVIFATTERLFRLVTALIEPLSSNFIYIHTAADRQHLIRKSIAIQTITCIFLFGLIVTSELSQLLFGIEIEYGFTFVLFLLSAIMITISRLLVPAFSIYKSNTVELSRYQYQAVVIFIASLILLFRFEPPIRVLSAAIIAEVILCLRIYRRLF